MKEEFLLVHLSSLVKILAPLFKQPILMICIVQAHPTCSNQMGHDYESSIDPSKMNYKGIPFIQISFPFKFLLCLSHSNFISLQISFMFIRFSFFLFSAGLQGLIQNCFETNFFYVYQISFPFKFVLKTIYIWWNLTWSHSKLFRNNLNDDTHLNVLEDLKYFRNNLECFQTNLNVSEHSDNKTIH